MKRNDLLAMLIRTLVVLNILDLSCTLILVTCKLATEANGFMDILLQEGPLIFGSIKMGITLISGLLLWLARKSLWAIPASLSLVGIMSMVVLVQVFMVLQLRF